MNSVLRIAVSSFLILCIGDAYAMEKNDNYGEKTSLIRERHNQIDSFALRIESRFDELHKYGVHPYIENIIEWGYLRDVYEYVLLLLNFHGYQKELAKGF